MESKKGLVAYLGHFLSLTWKLRPSLFSWIFLQSITKSANVFLTIYIPKLILDGLQYRTQAKEFLTSLIFIFGMKFVLYYAEEILSHKVESEMLLFERTVSLHLSEKTNRMKYESLENPEILEIKERAGMAMQMGMIFTLLEGGKQFVVSLFNLVGIVGILLHFSPWIFAITTVLAVLGILLEYKMAKKMMVFYGELVPINRKYNYFFEALNAENRQKEFRVYGNHATLIDKIAGFNFEIYEKLSKVYQVNADATSMGGFFDILSKTCLYAYAGLRVLGIFGTKILLGDFSVLIGVNENYSESLKSLGRSFASVLAGIPNLIPVFTFLDLEEREDKEDASFPKEMESLVFEGVSFSYPNTEKKILEEVSFEIKKGETLALVGRNNSGKSTIVKLICRLFEPTEGRILWNGTDIRELNYEEYLRQIATVFQDFKLFPISIAENILAEVLDEEEIPVQKEEKIWKILKEMEMESGVRNLKKGLNTMLNKTIHEEATAFSGGESQKLAIARAVYSGASFAILDEPTAALDPLAESEIYEHFSNLVKNKTSIFISHRMSASRFADRILVLEEGRITGNGNHKELLESNSLYHSLYEAQAQYYRE